jgi:hypothetical protein
VRARRRGRVISTTKTDVASGPRRPLDGPALELRRCTRTVGAPACKVAAIALTGPLGDVPGHVESALRGRSVGTSADEIGPGRAFGARAPDQAERRPSTNEPALAPRKASLSLTRGGEEPLITRRQSSAVECTAALRLLRTDLRHGQPRFGNGSRYARSGAGAGSPALQSHFGCVELEGTDFDRTWSHGALGLPVIDPELDPTASVGQPPRLRDAPGWLAPNDQMRLRAQPRRSDARPLLEGLPHATTARTKRHGSGWTAYWPEMPALGVGCPRQERCHRHHEQRHDPQQLVVVQRGHGHG